MSQLIAFRKLCGISCLWSTYHYKFNTDKFFNKRIIILIFLVYFESNPKITFETENVIINWKFPVHCSHLWCIQSAVCFNSHKIKNRFKAMNNNLLCMLVLNNKQKKIKLSPKSPWMIILNEFSEWTTLFYSD